jgi:VWFA-related protein
MPCVKNPHGGFVAGLTAANFRVLDNGRPQPITVFDSGAAPVTFGSLLDESSTMPNKPGGVIAATLSLIGQSNPRDQMSILHFNENVQRVLPDSMLFSDDIDQLHAALSRGLPQGRTALYDAVIAALEHLEWPGRQENAGSNQRRGGYRQHTQTPKYGGVGRKEPGHHLYNRADRSI